MSKPLVPWLGGKRKLAKHILPLIGEHTCYVEPFAGAGGIYFLKSPSKVEVLNDINSDIANLYRVVRYHMTELAAQFKWVLISRDNWQWLQSTPAETLTDIQRAAKFLYLQKMAFGAKVVGQNFGYSSSTPPRFNLLTLERDLEDAHLRLQRTYIENRDWQHIVKSYDSADTVFYLDPPYWQTVGYGVDFGWEQYEAIRTSADSIKGRMIISMGDHVDIRALFDGLTLKEIDYKYTLNKEISKQSKELVYTNF